MHSRSLPYCAIVLALGIAPLAMAQLATTPPCGMVVLLDKNLNASGLYPVGVLDVDGKQPFRDRTSYALAPGTHVLKLGERIPQGELSFQVQRNPDRSIRNRSFEIDIAADTRYLLAAKLDPGRASDPKSYWAPVVLEQSAGACKP